MSIETKHQGNNLFLSFWQKFNDSMERQINEMGFKEEDWRKSYETSSSLHTVLPQKGLTLKRIQKGYAMFSEYEIELSYKGDILFEGRDAIIQLLGIVRYFLKAGRIYGEYRISDTLTAKIDKKLTIAVKKDDLTTILELDGMEAAILAEFIEKMGQ